MSSRFVLNRNKVRQIESGLSKALMKGGLKLRDTLIDEVARDTGEHAQSITVRKAGANKVRVWSNLPQAKIEEFGRKPGTFPNLDSLVWWAARKWFHSWRKTASYDSLDSHDRGKIYVLARSIARKGIKPKHTYSNTRRRSKNSIVTFIRNAMRWLI